MTSTPPATGRTLAEVQIDLAVTLSDICARPPRWRGVPAAGAPAACAFFLMSAASAAWVEAAAAHSRIRAFDVSIEAMAMFAAIEASKATGRVQVVIAGAGPGTAGMLWALPGARGQGASVLVLAPRTPPHLIGAVDIQESSYRQPIHMAGAALYDEVIPMEHPDEMPRIALRLRHVFARPQGAVVQLCVPTSLLNGGCPVLPDIAYVQIAPAAPSADMVARVTQLLALAGGPPAFMLGSGCVAHRDAVAALLARWDAVHFTTPAAAGILPGSLGVVGNAASGDVPRRLRELGTSCVIVLGSRLGTASGGGDAGLFPEACHVVHVDADKDVTAANAVAAWNRPVLALTADIREFAYALLRDCNHTLSVARSGATRI